MGQRDAAVLGKGTASRAVPCSILPSSTQDQHCRERRCCGVCRVRPSTLLLSLPLSQCSASAFSNFRCPLVVFCTFQAVVVSHSPCLFWGLGPGSVQQAQCPGTMLESPGATSSDMVAGG